MYLKLKTFVLLHWHNKMIDKYVKIENEASLSKSVDSGAIINVDERAFDVYISNRNKRNAETKRLDNLENELSEIKELLLKLLAK